MTAPGSDPAEPPSFHRVVAADFDGTLTTGDRPPGDRVLAALAGARAAGLKVILVTGRIMADLEAVWPDVWRCVDCVVAENGAVLGTPTWRRLLGTPVDHRLDAALTAAGVPFRRGEMLLAAAIDDEPAIMAHVRALQLGCQPVANRGALMVLPAGVSKGTGLYEALGHLGLSFHNTVAVGDAENDLVLLETSELGVAVGDAVPSLRAEADLVLDGADGDAVADLLLGDVLRGRRIVHSRRWQIRLGTTGAGAALSIPASQINVLVTGPTGSGKSYVAGLLAEQLVQQRYSVLVVDPEGDHVGLARLGGSLVVGGTLELPDPDETLRLLHHRYASVVVDLSSLPPGAAVHYQNRLLTRVEAHRQETGLPHWVFLDEADKTVGRALPRWPAFEPAHKGYCLVTWRPDDLAADAVAALDAVIALGSPDPDDAVVNLAAAVGDVSRAAVARQLTAGGNRAVLTCRHTPNLARGFTPTERTSPHLRHTHKYDRRPLEDERRFHVRRSSSELTGARPANLSELLDELGRCERGALRHHCPRHDFSRWVAGVYHDRPLADRLAEVESTVDDTSPAATVDEARRALVRILQQELLG